MRNRAPEDRNAPAALRRTMLVVVIVALVAAAAFGSYVFARRDSNGIRSEATRREAELAQVQDQLRSAAKQNDYLAEQVRQGTRALSNAGSDSHSAEQRLRAVLRKQRKAQHKINAKLAKAEAKLHGLSSGLKGSVGSVTYTPPANKGGAATVQGSITISNSSGVALDAVCVVDVGTVEYAIMSHGVPSKGSKVESFQFPYAGPKPSGSSSGGCGRL
ncbi:MAG TPA: hypothetical protein VHV50_11180 [Actinomycetota bacterium]|nr:hypothetical protein [Actinomycetota bacterium]